MTFILGLFHELFRIGMTEPEVQCGSEVGPLSLAWKFKFNQSESLFSNIW